MYNQKEAPDRKASGFSTPLNEGEMMTSSVLCFGCAHIFIDSGKGRFVTCPECGFKLGRGRFNKIINYCYEAVRYGYDYRLAYEEHLEERGKDEECSVAFCLAAPEQALVFVAAAVASGIIGNAAYDAIKMVIKKINKSFHNSENNRIVSESLRVIEDEDEFQKFTKYIQDFHEGFKVVDEKVVKAIIEEILADKMTCRVERIIKNRTDPTDPESIKKDLRKSLIAIKKREVLQQSDFKNTWISLYGEEQ